MRTTTNNNSLCVCLGDCSFFSLVLFPPLSLCSSCLSPLPFPVVVVFVVLFTIARWHLCLLLWWFVVVRFGRTGSKHQRPAAFIPPTPPPPSLPSPLFFLCPEPLRFCFSAGPACTCSTRIEFSAGGRLGLSLARGLSLSFLARQNVSLFLCRSLSSSCFEQTVVGPIRVCLVSSLLCMIAVI